MNVDDYKSLSHSGSKPHLDVIQIIIDFPKPNLAAVFRKRDLFLGKKKKIHKEKKFQSILKITSDSRI
jgi:hypothetical protein